jgi:hypothetical protein
MLRAKACQLPDSMSDTVAIQSWVKVVLTLQLIWPWAIVNPVLFPKETPVDSRLSIANYPVFKYYRYPSQPQQRERECTDSDGRSELSGRADQDIDGEEPGCVSVVITYHMYVPSQTCCMKFHHSVVKRQIPPFSAGTIPPKFHKSDPKNWPPTNVALGLGTGLTVRL